ncbi:hypothetical protein BpHYR1_003325 [Brachionus plicatilis]|uniref:Uncharacterized protein n=1 Tax=Brachionus plicatilis TaxID=10195 RepID=A0A3M7R901_BRAPC|nr:hypothetical protein BpHYR1_003325 [Brachionus plicatilis]
MFDPLTIPSRHILDLDLVDINEDVQTLVTHVNDLDTIKSVLPSKKNMNEKAKYLASFRLAQDLCKSMKKLGPTRYEVMMQKLLELKKEIDDELYATNEDASSQENDDIRLSQSSVASTSSSEFSIIAPKIGRKKDVKKKASHGQLTMYCSNMQKINEGESEHAALVLAPDCRVSKNEQRI